MRPPSNREPPDPAVWAFVQDLVTRFETACQQEGAIAALEQFLPPVGNPLRLPTLIELIKSDLAIRWRRASRITLEEYLTRYPELLARPSQWPQLLYEEFGVRHAFGDKPALADYQQRFPEHFGALEKLLADAVGADIKLTQRSRSAWPPVPQPEPGRKPLPSAPPDALAGTETRRPPRLAAATRTRTNRLHTLPTVLFIALACVPLGWAIYEFLRPSSVRTGGMESSYRLESPGQVTVRAGESVPFTIQVARQNFTAPVRMTFSGLPAGVTLPLQSVPGDQEAIQVVLKTDLDARPGTHKVTLHATGANLKQETAFTIEVLPSEVVFRPDLGWTRVPQATVKADAPGRLFCDKIDVVRDGTRFRFLLVPRRPGEKKDIATYYILENKVSVAQFRRFAAANPEKVKCNKWQEPDRVGGGYPKNDYPVFNVPVEDAYRFARWLHGNLPTIDQWDKAAGRFEIPRGDGPFKGPWNKEDRLQIAVNRGDNGPMACGQATYDITPFGCRDMAGNGCEWTRNYDQAGQTLPRARPTRLDFVMLRGRTFRGTYGPLRFEDLDTDEQQNSPQVGFYGDPKPDLGFRVVIEP